MPLPEIIPVARRAAPRLGGIIFGLARRGFATIAQTDKTKAQSKVSTFRAAVLTKAAEDIADGKVEAIAGDIETTGKKRIGDPTGLKILEAALCPITPAGGKDHHQYYNPEEAIDPGLLSFHGIVDINTLPTFKSDWPRFHQALPKAGLLIMHNTTGVDSRALATGLIGINPCLYPAIPMICSQSMAMLMPATLGGSGQLGLRALAQIFEIEPTGPWHSAKTDAAVLAAIMPSMAEAVARNQQPQATTLALARDELADMTGKEVIDMLKLANPKLVNAHGTVLSLAKFGLYKKPTPQARTTEEVEPGPLFEPMDVRV